MRNVAWTLATLTILALVATTANADPWGRPGPGPGYYGHPAHRAPYYPAWRGAVVVQRPVYVPAPAPWYPPPPARATVVVPAPPPPVVVAPPPPAVVYPPAYYGPAVGIQYHSRNFGLSIGF